MTFAREFPDFPAADFPALPPTFSDSSWRNDVCPSLTSEVLKMQIFVDFADRARREFPEGGRYTVNVIKDEDFTLETVLDTDDWNEVLALVARHMNDGLLIALANGGTR